MSPVIAAKMGTHVTTVERAAGGQRLTGIARKVGAMVAEQPKSPQPSEFVQQVRVDVLDLQEWGVASELALEMIHLPVEQGLCGRKNALYKPRHVKWVHVQQVLGIYIPE